MESTIAAISTAYGEGGIGIIRISGEKAKEILCGIFTGKDNLEDRKMIYGHIKDPENGEIIDEVMAVYMKAPKTYTKEDIVEINCHGSTVSLRKTLDLVLRMGAVPAERGEFTKRAFLNGRLDLSQAEAVIDLIRAKTDKSFDVAMDQLSGHLSSKIKELRKSLTDVLVDITVNIDYPDEDIEEIMYSDMYNSLSQINDEVVKLISSAGTGRIINEGLKVAIIGRPNVGKSSLMNALLKEDRAIVTSIPGTTRDTIEEKISVRDIPVILTDTAGIRKTDDQIEKIGIEKSKASFNNADLIIFMVDASRTLDDEDMEIASYIGERKAILLINKTDLAREADTESLIKMMPQCKIIETSMTEERGIDELEDEIENLVYGGQIRQEESLIVSNARHLQLLRDASAALGDAMKMTEMEEALDFIEVDVKRAYDLLGEITGDSVEDDIINEVFKRFCLGK